MAFYHRTLHQASSITHSVIGNFLEEEQEDIIVSTGRILKLLRFKLDDTCPEIQTLISADTYDSICSLSKFRKADQPKDWIIIAADSGNVTILSIDAEKMEFHMVAQNTFEGHTPKTLPVLNLAVDSQGRTISTAAMEETKQYWFFRGPDYRQIHIMDDFEKKTLIYDIAFVDITTEKIVVAYLATAYEELHAGVRFEKRKRYRPWLIFKEVDGDKVTEIKRMKCRDISNSLISVPGEQGVLVCGEDYISFYSLDSSEIVRCSIPKRIMDPKAGVIFGCSTKCSLKMFQGADVSFVSPTQNSIYYLAQTEQGDIFKIQLVVNELGVNEIVLKYFITLPVASALCTFESGFLFVASEFGDHHIYRIADIEYRAKAHPSFSSALVLPNNKPFFFMHRTLKIAPVVEIKSMSPIMHMEFEPLSSMRLRMCLAQGRADLSALKISEVQPDVSYQYRATIETDEAALRMWVIKSTTTTKNLCKELKELIVVSFEASSAVYSQERLSEYEMEQIKELPFAKNTNTVGCARTGEDSILQVCPEGICHITHGQNMLILQTDVNDAIQECAFNKYSLVIACENKQLKHHTIGKNGYVMRSQVRRLINGPVTCMLLSDKSESNQLLAVGISIESSDSEDIPGINEVNLFDIGQKGMSLLDLLKIENSPYSFLFMNGASNLLSLLVGCENGELLTVAVEETAVEEGKIKHELKVVKTEKAGSEAVQLLPVHVLGKEQAGCSILAVSNQTWFKESVNGNFLQLKSNISPCICVMLDSESIITILEDELRVFILEDLNPKPPVTFPLEYTPKKFAVDSDTGNVYIIETDYNSFSEEIRKLKISEFEEHVKEAKKAKSGEPTSKLPALKNIKKAESWASLLRVVNLIGENTREVFKFSFDENEAALSLCLMDDLLLVGVAKQIKHASGQWWPKGASIYTYRILEQGKTFELLHKTIIKSAPTAMCCYEKMILIGIGRKLALYCVVPESSELKLVCEKKDCVSTGITAIYPIDERILVSDLELGINYVVYDPKGNSFHLLQEDVFPSEVTAACILSNNRMARATKSRDIFIVELGTVQDKDVNQIFNDDEPPFTLSEEKLLARFHVGEIVTSMQIFNNFPEHHESDSVVYTTLSGSVGRLLWLKDAEFLNSLYTTLINCAQEIDKSGHSLPIFPNARFRSYHFKIKNVIDGDFLDEFLRLEVGFQEMICKELELEDVAEISAELEKIRRESMLDFQF